MILGVAIIHKGRKCFMAKPNRHHDVIRFMVEQMDVEPPIRGEQGFFNEKFEFLTREEALKHAIEVGQITEHLHRTKLFSEDVWDNNGEPK